jgi:hypothetical protein
LKLLIRVGKRRRTGGLGATQVPDHTTTDDRGQIDSASEAIAVLFIGQAIGRQRETTPSQYGDQTLAAKHTDQVIEGHGGETADHRAPPQTEATMGYQQGVTGDLRAHLAIAQHEVGEDPGHRTTRGALET